MKLLVLIGNAAVGKMTVGQELTKITDMRLFHNHMSIELVLEVFGSRAQSADRRIREVIFEEFAAYDNYGLIFTYMWAFDRQEDRDYIENLCDIFRRAGTEIYYAELVTSQEVRLARNVTENRLTHKASKRNIEASNKWLLEADVEYRCVSNAGEIPSENYIRIDNTDITPDVAAKMIKDRFLL
jgi:shikimate kinase